MKKGKKRGKRLKIEIKVTEAGEKREERMIEGKRMIRWKRGAVGEENDEEERRGEVIGVCLCTYMLWFFSPLSNTVDVGSD